VTKRKISLFSFRESILDPFPQIKKKHMLVRELFLFLLFQSRI